MQGTIEVPAVPDTSSDADIRIRGRIVVTDESERSRLLSVLTAVSMGQSGPGTAAEAARLRQMVV